jgi:lipopolysaccharide transport system ATP-binding protein
MSSDPYIKVDSLSKCYRIYSEPRDRLKQIIFPSLQGLLRIKRKQYFREFWALKDLSFEIKKGETLGVIGKNGSGKSTLLQLICRTLNETSGKITSHGRMAALLELGSGFNPEFTGKENVYLNAAILGLTSAEIEERYDEIVKFADIGDFIGQPVKTYSSGMMVRLAFAVIAHVDADILVIDEALAVGDAVFTQKCMRFINAFRKDKILLFVSHDMQAITNVCSKAIWLKNGQAMAVGDTTEVINAYHKEVISDSAYESQKNYDDIDAIAENNNHGLTVDDSDSWKNDLLHNNQLNFKRTEVGRGHTLIKAAYISNNTNGDLIFKGGEFTSIKYLLKTQEDIKGLLVGFTLKDRLGQKIIEENMGNFVKSQPWVVQKDSDVGVTLTFNMPYLRSGVYMLDLAVAEGSIDNHISDSWIYDAIQVTVVAEIEMDSIFKANIKDFDYWSKISN